MIEPTSAGRPSRLHVSYREELLPLRRAEAVEICQLYWIPVNVFPAPDTERAWLNNFIDRIIKVLWEKAQAQPYVFIQYKSLYPVLLKLFLNTARDFKPLFGLSRKPGHSLAPPPSEKDIRDIINGKKEFQFSDYVADYCYWFTDRSEREQRQMFLGHGGLTMLFRKPDPKTAPPPLEIPSGWLKHPMFQKFDIQREYGQMAALSDPFRDISKQMFGCGLENDPQFAGLQFIIPLLSTKDFLERAEHEVETWFQLFDVYLNECESEGGIVLASKPDIEDDIVEILRDMKRQGAGSLEV